jgi:hypothetical protein
MELIVMILLMLKILKFKPNTPLKEKTKISKVTYQYKVEFVVTQRIEIDVYQTDKIGELADSLLET